MKVKQLFLSPGNQLHVSATEHRHHHQVDYESKKKEKKSHFCGFAISGLTIQCSNIEAICDLINYTQLFSLLHRACCRITQSLHQSLHIYGDRGSTVVKVLCYKSEGRWFDPRLCQWIFHRSHYGPGVDSDSNRNEYQEYFLGVKSGRCVRLTTLPPTCAVVMKSGNLNFRIVGDKLPLLAA